MTQHDKWIVGEGRDANRRWYVIHTREPRFIAEIFDDDELVAGGLTWSLPNDQTVGNVQFIDPPVNGARLDALMFSIGAVLETYDRRVTDDNQEWETEE